MIIYYVIGWLVVGLVLIAYSWGYKRGSRKIDLSGLGAAEAYYYFSLHELQRHRGDIAHIKADIKRLDRAGVRAPDIPLGLWIEVQKSKGLK